VEGWWIWQDDEEVDFWKEYSGIAKIGIDASKVSMNINEDVITISIPEAKILSIDIVDDSLSETYVKSKYKDKITSKKVAEAIDNSQNDIQETIKNNTSLLSNAQERAKKLIQNHIDKISKISGVEYKVEWITIPDSSEGGSN
jgi:predicted RNA-binding protein